MASSTRRRRFLGEPAAPSRFTAPVAHVPTRDAMIKSTSGTDEDAIVVVERAWGND